MARHIQAVLVLALAAGILMGGDSSNAAGAFDLNFKDTDHLLKSHVQILKPGVTRFNYSAVKNSKSLSDLVASFSSVDEKEFSSWSKNDQLAFLINAYNVFTIKLIIDHYPIITIKDAPSGGGVFGIGGSPWKREFFELLGESRSLDWIEHDMIRKRFSEPRIHFAVNCASIGCPALAPEAYVGSKLEKQLSAAEAGFLSDSERNRYDAKSATARVSKIFDWYRGDFEKKSGSLEAYLRGRISGLGESSNSGTDSGAGGDELNIDFLDYNWSLNDQSSNK